MKTEIKEPSQELLRTSPILALGDILAGKYNGSKASIGVKRIFSGLCPYCGEKKCECEKEQL